MWSIVNDGTGYIVLPTSRLVVCAVHVNGEIFEWDIVNDDHMQFFTKITCYIKLLVCAVRMWSV